MDIDFIIGWIVSHYLWAAPAFAWLGILVVVGTAIVALTPTKKDDELLAKLKAWPFVGPILAAVAKFSPVIPRNPPQ
jgi:hypothetical protein